MVTILHSENISGQTFLRSYLILQGCKIFWIIRNFETSCAVSAPLPMRFLYGLRIYHWRTLLRRIALGEKRQIMKLNEPIVPLLPKICTIVSQLHDLLDSKRSIQAKLSRKIFVLGSSIVCIRVRQWYILKISVKKEKSSLHFSFSYGVVR